MAICIKTARLQDRADDLYQEFFLALCEIKDNRLIEAYEGNYLPYFCYGIICNLWSNKDRVKRYENGRTSPLHYISDINLTFSQSQNISDDLHEYDFNPFESLSSDDEEYNHDIDELNEKALKQVEQDRQSEDRDIHFRANVFYYSYFKNKNPREFHKKTGIPYHVVLESYNKYKERLNQLCSQPTY